MPKNTVASWSLSLDCYCPHCDKYVDLLDEPDFWDGRDFDIGESVDDVQVWCPECGEEFLVDCEY